MDDPTLTGLYDSYVGNYPTNLNIVSIDPTTLYLTFSSPQNNSGLNNYTVYQAYTKDLNFIPIGSTFQTGYYISGLKTGSQYIYSVQANFSGYINNIVQEPFNISVNSLSGINILSWPNQTGVSGYRIYRTDKFENPFNSIGSTTGLNYIDSGLNQQFYYYRLTSLS